MHSGSRMTHLSKTGNVCVGLPGCPALWVIGPGPVVIIAIIPFAVSHTLSGHVFCSRQNQRYQDQTKSKRQNQNHSWKSTKSKQSTKLLMSKESQPMKIDEKPVYFESDDCLSQRELVGTVGSKCESYPLDPNERHYLHAYLLNFARFRFIGL